jgi:hypothetical protein
VSHPARQSGDSMAKNEQVNFVTGPVEMAARMHQDQQERIVNYIQGPQEQTRRTLVNGQPIDAVVDLVMQRIRTQGV